MVKKSLLPFIAVLLVILCGCAESSSASAGKIIPPSGQDSPLGGKWTVEREFDSDGNGDETDHQWVGSDVQFAAGAIAFGGQEWGELSYKIKTVNTADYLSTKYLTPPGISVSDNQDADVITVYASSNFLGEFMKLDDTNMIFFVQDKGLLLKKVSDQTDLTPGAFSTDAQDLNPNGNGGTSGILLGLKIPSETGYRYQTLWIAADHHQFHPVLAAEQLFFPRTSGFWELSVQDISAAGKNGNLLAARNVTVRALDIAADGGNAEAGISKEDGNPKAGGGGKAGVDKKDRTDAADKTGTDDEGTGTDEEGAGDQQSNAPSVKTIDYVGNDYVAVEEEADGRNQLQVLPVDKLSTPEKIKVSDFLGENGLRAYLSAREQAVADLMDKGVTGIEKDGSGENFGLVRKNGHWFLVGRISYQNRGLVEQTDFDIKVVPPANLIYYDTLVMSWHTIKDRVPDALDAFTSPGKDIVLVKTKNKLTVYAMGAEQLEETPMAEIDLKEGTTVIMAEWATGSYVASWERSFRSYGAQALSGSSVRIH